jgi:hypothetical protein
MRSRQDIEREFPPAVSLRYVAGSDLDAVHALIPKAKHLLSRALALAGTGQQLVKLFQPGTDGSLIYVYLHGPVKHIYIQPGPKPVEVVEEEVEEQAIEYIACPDMLNGVAVPSKGVLVTQDNPDATADYTLHEFHPTQVSASIYTLDFAWQDVIRLGVELDDSINVDQSVPQPGQIPPMQVHWPKPSMYSGAMKRVVQAIYGIGETERLDDNGKPEFYEAVNLYDYRWQSTDGIHRSGDTLWLVRISKEDGVMAMLLPLFECTTTDAFLEALQDIGDIETAAIVEEFGGLPTGETFPVDDPLAEPPDLARTDAIARGDVLQLLTADDLEPFYLAPIERTVTFTDHTDPQYAAVVSSENKNAYFEACGWAFSESGLAGEAHNTCWWYSNPQIALFTDFFNDGWVNDGYNNARPEHRYMRTEHWKVTLSLKDLTSEEDQQAPSAQLELVEMQPVEAPNHGIGSVDDVFPENYDVAPAAEEIHGRRMEFGGPPPPPGHEIGSDGNAMRHFRTGYHDWITGVDEFGVDEATGVGDEINSTGKNCIMASGFNPLTYEFHTGRDTSSGGHVINTVTFWCHDAMMMVPATTAYLATDSEKLERFKFWGRSQANIKLRDIEPAVAAPVYVFYNGEDLEIVYRQAERFNTDLAGGFQAGDFWATSLDLRSKVTSHPRYVDDRIGVRTKAMQTFFKIGLIIPSGVREGYVFMQYMFGPQDDLDYPPAAAAYHPHAENNSIKWFLFLAGVGLRECTLQYHQPRLESDAPDSTTPGSNGVPYSEIGVLRFMWWWQWTSEFYELGAISNAYQRSPRHLEKSKGLSWGASVSAQQEFYYTTDGPEIGFNPWDYPWWYFWEGSLPGFVIDQLPPPAPLFTSNLPDEVAIAYQRNPDFNGYTDARPTDVTFVGGL